MGSEPKMPALPEPRFTDCGVVMDKDGYSADQMRAYAQAYAAGIRAEVLGEVAGMINASKVVLLGARPSSLHDNYSEVSDERLRYLGQQITTLENPNE